MDHPLLPISDLSWIAIFQEFTPNDQMVASKMSLRCAGLVRAANRTVKTLVITDKDLDDPSSLDDIKYQINYFSLASKPAMRPLMDIPGVPSFPPYPMTAHFSKWHCLKIDSKGQIDTVTIKQITAIFSAVTNLKFILDSSERHCEYPVALLQRPHWQRQLTSLMVDGSSESRLNRELITAINDLTSLKQLALDWRDYTDLPDLTILGQLKVVAFRSYRVGTFVRFLEQYATDNTDLQVHLLSADSEGLLSLSQPLHSRIVHFGHFDDDWLDLLVDWTRLCSQFRSLTSLKICLFQLTEVGPLFTALSQLHQLVRLELVLYPVSDEEGEEDEEEDEEELPPAPRPLAQINSLKALELYLIISSHSEIEWLNLPWTMPNLQTINIWGFSCASCNVVSDDWRNSTLSLLNSPSALSCFQSSLFTLHSGVPLNRFILSLSQKKSISVETLLLQSTSEQPVTTDQ